MGAFIAELLAIPLEVSLEVAQAMIDEYGPVLIEWVLDIVSQWF